MAIPASNASEFYSSLPEDDAEAFAKLAAIVDGDNPLREAEWIDYKSGFDEHAKAHWSKGLSGFANSGGGILLWGIRTKPKDKYDIPDKIALVEKANELAGNLDTWKSTVVDPPVLGTAVRAIAGKDGRGFVVAYIPESGLKPHQATAAECHGQYYVRVGHQTLPASQSLLRSLFYPQFDPVLNVAALTIDGGTNTGHRVALQVKNLGTSTLYDLFAIVKCETGKLTFVPNEIYAVCDWETETEASLIGSKHLHPEAVQNLGNALLFFDSKITLSIYGRDMKPVSWDITGAGRGKFNADLIDSR